MASESPRQRVLEALAHIQPAHVPVDIGGSNVTTIVDTRYERLKAVLGVRVPTAYIGRRARQAAVDEETVERLGTCTRPLYLGKQDLACHQRGDGTAAPKRDFWAALTSWGAIDTHRVLLFGLVPDVREEVRRRIGDLAAGGGFVLAAVHDVRDDVPRDNLLAMADAAAAFG